MHRVRKRHPQCHILESPDGSKKLEEPATVLIVTTGVGRLLTKQETRPNFNQQQLISCWKNSATKPQPRLSSRRILFVAGLCFTRLFVDISVKKGVSK